MRRPVAAIGFSMLLAVCGTASGNAQTLEAGTWTGTMTPPGNPTVDVTFAVSYENGNLAIVLSVPQANMTAPFHDVELEDDALSFWWEPGVRVDCKLTRQDDGSFAGDCSDGGGGTGQLTMVPPPDR